MENGVDRLVNWAIYFSDFSRYQLPFAGAVVDWVTDVNISYRRSALEATRSLWSDRYHETTVHWELVRLGEELYLSPEPIVDQMRSRVSWAQLLSERYHWGRLFGYTRARECSSTQRLAYFCGSLLLPFLLLFRHAKMQFQKRKRFLKFLQAAPLVFVLALFWSFGEAHAYATSRA